MGLDGLALPPRPEALDEQRIDDLIAENLAAHKLEVLRSDELVRPSLPFPLIEHDPSHGESQSPTGGCAKQACFTSEPEVLIPSTEHQPLQAMLQL